MAKGELKPANLSDWTITLLVILALLFGEC